MTRQSPALAMIISSSKMTETTAVDPPLMEFDLIYSFVCSNALTRTSSIESNSSSIKASINEQILCPAQIEVSDPLCPSNTATKSSFSCPKTTYKGQNAKERKKL
eukprot:TRINITY_DN8889_c0_g1_i2.p1 TRINITY_DN8889_c0_g1~~TRINITY_DN8889_c0_g1_i2.p1  ORF type:complete len:105 (+),score=8.98 TRINITY_DN8889_c0_g1_i2:620-934(+)